MKREELTVEYLKECFIYLEGRLYWNPKRPRFHFKSDKTYKCYMSRNASKPFGAVHGYHQTRYIRGMVSGVLLLEHVIVWVLFNNEFPERQIDHIDGNGLNNNIENLRTVLPKDQNKNQPLRKDNKSGYHGVKKHQKNNSWVVTINSEYKGTRKTLEEAVAFRKELEVQYNYHENHGRLK